MANLEQNRFDVSGMSPEQIVQRISDNLNWLESLTATQCDDEARRAREEGNEEGAVLYENRAKQLRAIHAPNDDNPGDGQPRKFN